MKNKIQVTDSADDDIKEDNKVELETSSLDVNSNEVTVKEEIIKSDKTTDNKKENENQKQGGTKERILSIDRFRGLCML